MSRGGETTTRNQRNPHTVDATIRDAVHKCAVRFLNVSSKWNKNEAREKYSDQEIIITYPFCRAP